MLLRRSLATLANSIDLGVSILVFSLLFGLGFTPDPVFAEDPVEDTDDVADDSPFTEPTPSVREAPTVVDGTPPPIPRPRDQKVLIEHPQADKGLIRVTRDRSYIYRIDRSEQSKVASVKFGIFEPTELENPDTNVSFDENYDATGSPLLLFDWTWQFFKGPLGIGGLTLGIGAYVNQGEGRFENPELSGGLTPKEVFTFIMLPLSLGVNYQLQWFDDQLIVPYGVGGMTLFGFSEIRDDDRGPKFGGAAAAYAGGGFGLNLSFFDARSVFDLDREYGINNVYLVAEYRLLIGLSRYDFTSNVFALGFAFDF